MKFMDKITSNASVLIIAALLAVTSAHATDLYELKGDRLGMALSDFKAKYKRSVKGHNKSAPWCSDARPRQEIITLLSKPYFANANIVNCRIAFPFESYRGNSPTVAGVETSMYVHHFIDEKLFKITVIISHNGFFELKEALIAKYGKPSISDAQQYQNRMGARFSGDNVIWENDSSKIMLIERMGSLDTSALFYTHNELLSVAEKRKPSPSTDDL